jgi:hypothetical protein
MPGGVEMMVPRPSRGGSGSQSRYGPRNKVGNKFDPEYRFAKATRWGEPSTHRPDLGPCLLYIGADNGNGYGQFRHNGKNGYAHRYAWERKHGPIPKGLTVDHLCRVRSCVNVTHMELTDRLDNYLRGVKTRNKCSKGHEYTPDNLYTNPQRPGVRFCKTCRDDTAKRGALRRSNAYKGIPSARTKYDLAARDRLVIEAVEGRLSVREAAAQLGCAYKYMDKLVGKEARARGIANRKKQSASQAAAFNGWTERKTRVAVRNRSDGICERCGSAEATDMHHRKNRSQSGKWHPANIMHLCALCHVEITAHPNESVERGHTVLSHQEPTDVPVLYRSARVFLTDDGDYMEVAA